MTGAGRKDTVICLNFHSKYKWKHECLFLSPQTKASNWSHLGDRVWIKGHYVLMRYTIALNLPGVQVWVYLYPERLQECRFLRAPAHASASCSPCRDGLYFTRITSLFMNNKVQIVLFFNTTLTLKELEIQYSVP